MYRPTLKEYLGLFQNIFTEVILKYRYVKVTALICALSVFISTYYFTKVAEASSLLLDSNSKIPFIERLGNLAFYSFLSLSLKHIPLAFFTFIIQLIARDKFIENLKAYMDLPYTEFHKKTPGEMRFTIFLKSLSYPMCPQIVIFDFVGLIGTIIFTFIKAYTDINIFAALIFLFFPLIYSLSTLVFLKYRISYHTLNLEEQQKTSARIYDKLSNYDIIKTYNMENEEIEDFHDKLKRQADCQLRLDMFIAKSRYIIRFVMVLPYVIFGALSFIQPNLMNGKTLFQAILLYSSLSLQIKKLGTQLGRLTNLLNQIRFDSIESNRMHIPTETKLNFESSIQFDNVSLYHDSNLIVRNINLIINKGEKIAVVGYNGTGKSTFIKSLFRFTKYTGKIRIDESDLEILTNKSIFDLITYIPQEDFTSDDTILNNLRLGRKNSSFEYIKSKAKFMEAHETFMNLEDGYNTQAGIKGHRLSGGQKQKLSLVRAAVKDSPIFVLDEATAAIDKGYEKKAMEILLGKLENKTLIMIIHNKEYLKEFDKIIFLANGTVAGCSNYEDLLQSNEEFRNFIVSH